MPTAPAPPTAPARHGRKWGFRALKWPGYRIYFASLIMRGIAVWVQLVSIPLLAVALGATPIELGIITALLFLTMLFSGAVPLGLVGVAPLSALPRVAWKGPRAGMARPAT